MSGGGGGMGGMQGGGMQRSFGGPNLQNQRPGMGGSPFGPGGMANNFLHPGQSPLMGGRPGMQGGMQGQYPGMPGLSQGGNMGYGGGYQGQPFNPAQGGGQQQAHTMEMQIGGPNDYGNGAQNVNAGWTPQMSQAQQQAIPGLMQSMLSQGGSQGGASMNGQPGMMYAGGSPAGGQIEQSGIPGIMMANRPR